MTTSAGKVVARSIIQRTSEMITLHANIRGDIVGKVYLRQAATDLAGELQILLDLRRQGTPSRNHHWRIVRPGSAKEFQCPTSYTIANDTKKFELSCDHPLACVPG